MTQEQKAKAYDEAFNRAREWHNDSHITIGLKGNLEDIFPELKESEDERIRKELIEYIKDQQSSFISAPDCRDKYEEEENNKYNSWIAWLEKQEGCEYIKKDWLEHIKQSWYKEGFIDGKYSGGTSKEWTINDAATLKELIDFLENGTAKLQHDLTKYANWLKIQFTPIEKRGEQKSADKIEPKFHEGDWVVTSYGKVNQVIAVDEDCDGFTLDDDTYFSGSWKDGYHLWTIQDAKDGDVLACPLPKGYEDREQIFIFKGINSRDYVENCIEYYCRICDGVFYVNENGYMGTTSSPLYPATKSQRDTLFAKMKEAGFEWDSEKKELKKISQHMISAEAKEAMYDKPTDNDMVEALRTEYEKGRADVLRDIKPEIDNHKTCGECGYYMPYVKTDGDKDSYGDCASIGMNNECFEGNNHFKDPDEELLQVEEKEKACGYFKVNRPMRVRKYIKDNPIYSNKRSKKQ